VRAPPLILDYVLTSDFAGIEGGGGAFPCRLDNENLFELRKIRSSISISTKIN
jgi:hypothetical protein